MNQHTVTQLPSPGSTRVALLTGDAIMALDIGEALKSAGFIACFDTDYDLARFETEETAEIRAAIVDLNMHDARSNAILPRLAARRIPTILISAGLEGSEDAGSQRHAFPNVIAHFSKPFVVDEVVPALVSASGPDVHGADAICAGAVTR